MSIEIERKFLVNKEKWLNLSKPSGVLIQQGYLIADPKRTIRVRIVGEKGFLTIKGKTINASRTEFEYEIPYEDARQVLANLSIATVSKVRYKMMHLDRIWEVDEFLEENKGLIVAEIELKNEQEDIELPDWAAQEVTDDERYYNANLSIKPYKQWKQKM